MHQKQIIKEIETRFSRYYDSTSDTMLYYTTKHLIDFLNSFGIVKVVLANLKNEYPYDKKTFENPQEGFEAIKYVAQDQKQYVSFVLHYLEYSYTTDSIEDFYDEASWICLSNEEYDKKERIKLFKIDVVKPLCDYVTDELRKNVSLLYVLDRFKNRTMRFESPYLKDYVSKLNSHIGVLCIFTTQDYEFTWLNKPYNLEILTIYVGGLNPSERNTKIISLDFNSGL